MSFENEVSLLVFCACSFGVETVTELDCFRSTSPYPHSPRIHPRICHILYSGIRTCTKLSTLLVTLLELLTRIADIHGEVTSQVVHLGSKE